jgi:hypothetical protein
MVRDNRHDSAYLFGAICHARKVGAAIIMPSVNAEAMSEHLKEISTQIALGAHAVVVCDGAGWHQSGGRLRVPHNLVAALAALRAGTQSDGEHLGLSPWQQTQQTGLEQLSGNCRRLQRRLALPAR